MFEHITDPELLVCLERFLCKIENYSSDDMCWNWTGSKIPKGYGSFWFKGKLWRAPRVSYLLKYGKLTPKLEIDHLCRNKACVNPLHLEEVDKPTNVLRGDIYTRNKTHCKRGHEFTEANTYHGTNTCGGPQRQCKTCRRLRWRGEI